MRVSYSLTFSGFCDLFRDANRDYCFSYEGKRALYDWLEGYYDCCGDDAAWDGDVVALCCEFSEESWKDIASNYRIDVSPDLSDEECKEAVIEYLQDNTLYVGEGDDGQLVYQVF